MSQTSGVGRVRSGARVGQVGQVGRVEQVGRVGQVSGCSAEADAKVVSVAPAPQRRSTRVHARSGRVTRASRGVSNSGTPSAIRRSAEDRREVGMAGKKRLDDGLVLFGLAGAGGVDKPPAGATAYAAFASIRCCRAAAWRTSSSATPPADVDVAAERAEAGARARRRSTRSKTAGNGGADREIVRDDVRACARACRAARGGAPTRRSRASPATRRPRRRRAAARARVLPPGAAHASSTRCPGRAPTTQRHELRGLVLHQEIAGRWTAACAADCPRRRPGHQARTASARCRRPPPAAAPPPSRVRRGGG